MLRRLFALAAVVAGPAFGQEAAYRYFVSGNPEDVRRPVSSGILMAGGGRDVDEAFRWFLRKAGGGDILVLRASGADGYHDYLAKIAPADSVETIVFRAPEASRDEFVLGKIRGAEAIFFAGGDQWNYVRFWKGTPVEKAIHERVRAGVPVGGTSAGLAILGQYSFSAERDTVTSAEALANELDPKIAIESRFLSLPHLGCLITDSHFSRRDRMGRLLVFLKRIAASSECAAVHGLGVDERTAVLVEADGSARVVGDGKIYLVKRAAGDPASREFEVTAAGGALDLARRRAEGETYRLTLGAGTLASSKANGAIY